MWHNSSEDGWSFDEMEMDSSSQFSPSGLRSPSPSESYLSVVHEPVSAAQMVHARAFQLSTLSLEGSISPTDWLDDGDVLVVASERHSANELSATPQRVQPQPSPAMQIAPTSDRHSTNDRAAWTPRVEPSPAMQMPPESDRHSTNDRAAWTPRVEPSPSMQIAPASDTHSTNDRSAWTHPVGLFGRVCRTQDVGDSFLVKEINKEKARRNNVKARETNEKQRIALNQQPVLQDEVEEMRERNRRTYNFVDSLRPFDRVRFFSDQIDSLRSKHGETVRNITSLAAKVDRVEKGLAKGSYKKEPTCYKGNKDALEAWKRYAKKCESELYQLEQRLRSAQEDFENERRLKSDEEEVKDVLDEDW